MKNESNFYENSRTYLKSKAEKALKKAKELEASKMNQGMKYQKLNDKTLALR